jgi:hypothetical protein
LRADVFPPRAELPMRRRYFARMKALYDESEPYFQQGDTARALDGIEGDTMCDIGRF